MIKFRASSVGKLTVGSNEITTKQLEKIQELEDRKAGKILNKGGKVAPFTAKMKKDLEELIAKRDAPIELGETGKSYVLDVWLKNKYKYDKPVVVDVMLKGHLCEQDSIGLISDQVPEDQFRVKNEENFNDDYFTGTPDIILDRVVEDAKTCWTVKTFMKAWPDALYLDQAQVYMHLTGRKKYRLCYCLVNTPAELIDSEKRKYFFKYGANEDNPHYLEACKKIDAMHNVEWMAASDRIKVFEFDYNPDRITLLQEKVELARKYYDTLSLGKKRIELPLV